MNLSSTILLGLGGTEAIISEQSKTESRWENLDKFHRRLSSTYSITLDGTYPPKNWHSFNLQLPIPPFIIHSQMLSIALQTFEQFCFFFISGSETNNLVFVIETFWPERSLRHQGTSWIMIVSIWSIEASPKRRRRSAKLKSPYNTFGQGMISLYISFLDQMCLLQVTCLIFLKKSRKRKGKNCKIHPVN